MANANRPSGLAPVKYLNGADWDGGGNMYFIGSAEANKLSIGDPVKLSGDGDTTRGIPGVVQATAGAACVGVIAAIGTNAEGGPYIDPSNLSIVQAPATKTQNYYALVIDDPNVIFEVQEGGASTALTSAAIGENIDFLAAAPATGVVVSGFTVNNGAHDTSSTRNCRLFGLVRRSDNAFGAFAKWLVLINNHQYRSGVTGV